MTSPDSKKIIREQFNRQALNFSKWSVTSNTEYSRRYVEFCRMTADDTLLDISCGSGEFCLFCAPLIARATGLDLSDRMIELARAQQQQRGLTNVVFERGDASQVPYPNQSFSLVISKSAFHHYVDHPAIFKEMKRCCIPNGRISVQDIVAYDQSTVNAFFESFERLVDASHHITVSKTFILDLYQQNGIEILSTMDVEIELHLNEYLNHATRSEQASIRLQRLVESGLRDSIIRPFFTFKDDELYFRRKVFVVLGRNTG